MKPNNEAGRSALALLNRRVAEGIEYPIAEWRAYVETGVPAARLRELYDNQFT